MNQTKFKKYKTVVVYSYDLKGRAWATTMRQAQPAMVLSDFLPVTNFCLKRVMAKNE